MKYTCVQLKNDKEFETPLSIFSAIRAGKQVEAVEELLSFLQKVTLAHDHFSYAKVSNLFLRLLSRLFDLVEEIGIQDKEVDRLLYLSNEELLKKNELSAMEAMKKSVERLAKICQEKLSFKNEDRTSFIKTAIENGFSKSSFSLTEVAEQIGLHPDYLSRIFKENTGETFIEYLTQVRIQRSLLC